MDKYLGKGSNVLGESNVKEEKDVEDLKGMNQSPKVLH